MAEISFVTYSFTYPGGQSPALADLSLEVEPGEFLLLCGPTGSGKSTLLRSLKPELAPAGQSEGALHLPVPSGTGHGAGQVGLVMQDADNQLVMDTVRRELAFGLENLGLPPDDIRRRIAETAAFFGIEDLMERRVHTLSGGQKQMLNLASVVAMQPQVLLLDEPTAQLDPIASKSFLQLVGRLNGELGLTVILSEHRLEDALPLCGRVVFLEQGGSRFQGTPRAFARHLLEAAHPFQAALPEVCRLYWKLGGRGEPPLQVRQGRRWLAQSRPVVKTVPETVRPASGCSDAICVKHAWFRYDRRGADVLCDCGLSVRQGEIHALLGGNGSGKSTLLGLISGVLRPQRGGVKLAAGLRAGLLSQNPRAMFTCDTLGEELLEWQAQFGYPQAAVDAVCVRLGLTGLLERHPYDLSGGETQKAALAKLLLLEPDVLLLDEPTKGVDAAARAELIELLEALRAEGKTILLSTHDTVFAAALADRCSMLFGHTVICTQDRRAFFDGNLHYTTQVNQLLRGCAAGCVGLEDVADE